MALLDRRGGLMAGICNGFQALIKLGLVPYGRIIDPGPDDPTLTFNTIGRHQSRIVRVRVPQTCRPGCPARSPARSAPFPSPTARAVSWRTGRPSEGSPTKAKSPHSMWT